MMRRGSRVVFAHFHSQPYTDASSTRQVAEIVEILTRHQYATTLYLLPLAPSQKIIAAECPEPLRTLLYRRMMMRIASRSLTGKAPARSSPAIRSGRSRRRPREPRGRRGSGGPAGPAALVGRDKEEIVAEAASSEPSASSAPCQEACVLFEPKRPATKARIDQVRAAEGKLDLDTLVAAAIPTQRSVRSAFPDHSE